MTSKAARAVAKFKRIAADPQRLGAELRFLRHGVAQTESEKRLDPVGTNWHFRPDLPIAVAFEVAKWKREHLAHFLSDYRVVYASRKVSETEVAEFLSAQGQPDLASVHYLVWGRRRRPSWLSQGKLVRVEDGFLRSIGPGLYHSKPYSLVFDGEGIYFDTRSASDLRGLIYASDSLTPVQRSEALSGMAVFRLMELTKYYPMPLPSDGGAASRRAKNGPMVLVVGQMENDASLSFGTPRSVRPTNAALLQRALEENPRATVLYRRHPDERHTLQTLALPDSERERIEVLPADMALHDAFGMADHVYTWTSLSGFEAMLMGKPVTVLGRPFYSGWGLEANSAEASARAAPTRELHEVFHAAYLNYPRYIHPDSHSSCTFFDLASYFFVERFCYGQVLGLNEDQLPRELMDHGDRLSRPMHLLFRLQEFQYPGDAGPDDLADILDTATLADMPQLGRLLVQASSYDALLHLSRRTVELLERDWPQLRTQPAFLRALFEAYASQQKSSNGRVLPDLPDVGTELAELASDMPIYQRALLAYFETRSNNLNYGEITRVLDALETRDTPSHVFHKLVSILQARPSRSERRADLRHALTDRAIRLYRRRLDATFQEPESLFLNSALESIARRDPEAVIGSFRKLARVITNGKFHLADLPSEKQTWVMRRLSSFYELYHYFLKTGRVKEANSVLEFLFGGDRKLNESLENMNHQLTLTKHASLAKHDAYIDTYIKAPASVRDQTKTRMAFARALKGAGELERARAELNQLRRMGGTPRQIVGVQSELDRLNFVIRTDEILETYPQPKLPRGVIILASQTCYNTLAMMVPALLSLRKQGYAVVNLMEGMNSHAPTGLDFIDRFAGSLSTRLRDLRISNDWEVNWAERYVGAHGINFYQGFYERLSTQHRNFFVDINMPLIRQDFDSQLMRADLALSLCRRIHSQIVGRGLDVAIVSGNSHVTPFSVFRDYARAVDDPKLSFINCNVAYESYFSNLGSKLAHTMCVTDMTLHKNRRAPFMATREGFESWYADNRDNREFQERADALIKVNRNSSSSSESAERLVSELTELRESGKTVIACFGKVPVDLNVPYDGGPAHADMSDWITHTVDIAARNPDIVLLIKPHPHELRPEIALDLIGGFSDLIQTELPPNVRILGHREINTHALAPHLDMAILYNGSSSLELTALGVPVLMASHFGRHDYPLELLYPKDREHYERFIADRKYRRPSEELRKRAAFLISYLGTSHVSTRNTYSRRQVTNDKVGFPVWHEEEIAELVQNGDPAMDAIAAQITEKFRRNREAGAAGDAKAAAG